MRHFRHEPEKDIQDGGGSRYFSAFRRDIVSAGGQHSHEKNSHNRADGGQTDKTEAVAFRVAAAYRRNPHAQSENKGNRHGAGGRAARIKPHSEKFRAGKSRAEKEQRVENGQQFAQGKLKNYAQQRQADKKAHSCRDHEYQCSPGNGGGDFRDLYGQYLYVRFGHGDDEADNKTGDQQQGKIALVHQGRPGPLSHGEYADIGPYQKKGQAHYDQYPPQQKGDEQISQWSQGKMKETDQGHDGQHRDA